MSDKADFAVKEWAVARPRVRRDVEVTFHKRRSGPVYVVEDLMHRRYFQVGLPEYQFIQSLNGKRTVGEAIAISARALGANAISEPDALKLVRWLVDNDLLDSDSAGQAQRRYDLADESVSKKPKQPWFQKVVFLKIPMGNPDGFFLWLQPILGWLFSGFALFLWIILLSVAGYTLVQNWDQFRGGASQIILPENWIIMILTFGVLKIVHEIGHGVATRKFGGVVPEWGVQMLLFITPLTFVDASASWRFPGRIQRMAVAAAGMYVELGVAAIAILVWANSDGSFVGAIAYNAIFAASVITVLFNANPLMRFDGYYLACDLLNIPNLGQRGQAVMSWFYHRWIIGMKKLTFPAQAKQAPVIISLYGVGALLWRILIWAGIMIALSLFAKGAGLLLVGLMIGGMLLGMLGKFFKLLHKGYAGLRPNPFLVLVRLSFFAAVIGSVFYFVEFRPYTRAVAVVTYPSRESLRTELAGFVDKVFVENGEVVEEGHLLARLTNPEQVTELGTAKLDVTASRLRVADYLKERQMGAYQAELENLSGLNSRYQLASRRVKDLDVFAPVSGRVFLRRPEMLPGRFLRPGSEILSILPEEAPELVVSADQRAVDAFETAQQYDVNVRIAGRPGEPLPAKVIRIEKTATIAVPHAALASSNGGPLPVRQKMNAQSERAKGLARSIAPSGDEMDHFVGLSIEENDVTQLEFPKARLTGYATVEPREGDPPLREGEWGFAKLYEADTKRLGIWIYEGVSRWLISKWEQATQA
ncbi:MAG: HlyD family efflux transporter periplasmic adaptor subunit [Verrucomicrobiales bacterium]|nr:HlyD family efflux transporter periplasmic adaptor subunit [Verrucomicrobiales bacterium]